MSLIGKELGIIMLICIVSGMAIGYLCCYYSNVKTTPEQIEYVEHLLDNPYEVYGLITDNSTVKSIRAHYYHYDFISRSILEYQLERICGVKEGGVE